GISYFATAITEEKEQRTLGLLRMADINPVSILLGKSVPRMLAAVLLLVVQVPFTLLAVTLGGVMLNQVVAAYVTLLAHILFLANLALVFSVVCGRSGAANRMMVVWCLGLYLLPEIFLLVPTPPATPEWVLEAVRWLRETSAFYRLREVLSTGFSDSPFGTQVIANSIGAFGLFLVAWALFDRFGHDEEGQPARRRGRWASSSGGARLFGTRRAWPAALVWKDFYYLSGGRRMLVLKFALYGILLAGIAWYVYDSRYSRFSLEDYGGVAMGITVYAIIIELAVIASRVFLYESRERTLSTLLMLPQSTLAIGWSKAAGCLIGLAPALVWFVAGVVCAPDDFGEVFEDVVSEPGGWFAVAQIVLFVHVVALLSLFVSWGALPLTFGGFVFAYACCTFSMFHAGPGDSDALFVMLTVGTWFCVVGAQFAIGERLKHLAARQ
ncbi:MAG TPA: hypothetical protein VML55_01640, partial [Planctomycetaceae bacterium]|nr:hypothetical protein [Planctomycetaceae bacterium]